MFKLKLRLRGFLLTHLPLIRGFYSQLNNINSSLDDVKVTINKIENELIGIKSDPYFELNKLTQGVEIYQPLFGTRYKENATSRNCEDRFNAIYNYFKKDLTNIRVLDIGSSLGYFPLKIGSVGGKATGWEHVEQNVRISNYLNSYTNVNFELKALNEETINLISNKNYDVVLILSTLHHVISQIGYIKTKEIFNKLLKEIPIVIVEFAIKDENVEHPWINLLPSNPLDMIDNINDYSIEKIGDFQTHLSNIKRPLYVIKYKIISVNDKLYKLNTVAIKAYSESSSPIFKIYYKSNDYFIKIIKFIEINSTLLTSQIQAINEIFVLSKINHYGYNDVCLIDFEINKDCAKIVLNNIQGKLVSEIINILSVKQKLIIINGLVKDLKNLNTLKLFHNDVRTWNVIFDIDTNKVTLIDYGLAGIIENENTKYAIAWFIKDLIAANNTFHKSNINTMPDFNNLLIPTELINVIKVFEDDYEDLNSFLDKLISLTQE